MKIRVLAMSSADGRALNNGAILDFSGKIAGLYTKKKSFREILREPFKETLKRAEDTLESTHHGVFGHQTVTLFIEDAPKILTMVLNNEGLYNASENPICWTTIKATGLEEEMYQKWRILYADALRKQFPKMDEDELDKWTLIYAQYLISVFTPSTSLAYTTSIKRINYIIGWMENYIAEAANGTEFTQRLAQVFAEFIREFNKDLLIPGLRDPNNRTFSLFGTRERKTEWGENYCVSYKGSFAQLAQAQTHRKIHYEFRFLPEKTEKCFYVPDVLRDENIRSEWQNDAKLLMGNFPQGMLVLINERGTCEDFVLKCSKRLNETEDYLDEFISQTATTLMQYYDKAQDQAVKSVLYTQCTDV